MAYKSSIGYCVEMIPRPLVEGEPYEIQMLRNFLIASGAGSTHQVTFERLVAKESTNEEASEEAQG